MNRLPLSKRAFGRRSPAPRRPTLQGRRSMPAPPAKLASLRGDPVVTPYHTTPQPSNPGPERDRRRYGVCGPVLSQRSFAQFSLHPSVRSGFPLFGAVQRPPACWNLLTKPLGPVRVDFPQVWVIMDWPDHAGRKKSRFVSSHINERENPRRASPCGGFFVRQPGFEHVREPWVSLTDTDPKTLRPIAFQSALNNQPANRWTGRFPGALASSFLPPGVFAPLPKVLRIRWGD